MSIARNFTAWAVFGYHGFVIPQLIESYHLRPVATDKPFPRLIFYYMKKTPCISKPPVTPLPDYAEVTKFTGELYVQYPLQLHPTPIQFGTSFLTQMKLNKIMFKINKASSCAGSPATAPPTLRQAIKYYHQLKNWARALPEALQPSKIVMPHCTYSQLTPDNIICPPHKSSIRRSKVSKACPQSLTGWQHGILPCTHQPP